jgi:hypothetical protein
MTSTPQLLERHPQIIELSIPNVPGVLSFNVGVDSSLNSSFSGPSPAFSVENGGVYRSKTLRINKINRVYESNKGLTRASVDLDDLASATIPGDNALSFFRVTEVLKSGPGTPGPILVVPPPNFLSSSRKVLNLFGTSPNVAPTPSGLPPAGCMTVVLPRFCDRLEFSNSGASTILLSFDPGVPEMPIPSGSSQLFEHAGIKRIFIHTNGATSNFRILAYMVDGISH